MIEYIKTAFNCMKSFFNIFYFFFKAEPLTTILFMIWSIGFIITYLKNERNLIFSMLWFIPEKDLNNFKGWLAK